uniref:Uncharacterized protein n=1 Tax=Arundo donax TaxID=35708 RepID=A0A0A9F5X9_ARUDO
MIGSPSISVSFVRCSRSILKIASSFL